MEQNELNEILKKHNKWINGGEGGEYADMRGADMSGADMSGADMRRADMSGANIDYSVWPLWCGSLTAHVDDRIAIQLLYHTLSVVQHSPYVSGEVKRALLTDTVVGVANRFHRVKECGRLKAYPVGDDT